MVPSDPAQGLVHHYSRLASRLSLDGVEMHVFTCPGREQTHGLSSELEKSGVKLHYFRELSVSGVRALLSPRDAIGEKLDSLSPDIVHCFGPVALTQLSGGAPKAKRCVSIAAAGSGSKFLKIRSLIGARLLRSTDAVIALSETDRQRWIAASIPSERLRVVPNPLDVEELLQGSDAPGQYSSPLDLSCDSPIIGVFANLTPNKNHLMFLRALRMMKTARWRALIVGSGSCGEILKRRASEWGLAGRVTFVPRVPLSHAMRLLRECKVVVHCSRSETFGNSIVEPLLFGKAVISTPVGVAPELSEEGLIQLVSIDAHEELSERLEEELCRGLSVAEAGRKREYVEKRFSVGAISRQMRKIYSELVQM